MNPYPGLVIRVLQRFYDADSHAFSERWFIAIVSDVREEASRMTFGFCNEFFVLPTYMTISYADSNVAWRPAV